MSRQARSAKRRSPGVTVATGVGSAPISRLMVWAATVPWRSARSAVLRTAVAGWAAMSSASLRSAPAKLVAVPPAIRAPYWASLRPSRSSSIVVVAAIRPCLLWDPASVS